MTPRIEGTHYVATPNGVQSARRTTAYQRRAAQYRGDEDELRRINEDERETLELLEKPAVPICQGAGPGEIII